MKVSRTIRWIALMLIALFVAPLVASAAPSAGPTDKTGYSSRTVSGVVVTANGTLTGRVTDPDGFPLSGATVSAGSSTMTISVRTDTNGYYSMSLPPATYTVKASAYGYRTQYKTATVTSRTMTTLNFSLMYDNYCIPICP